VGEGGGATKQTLDSEIQRMVHVHRFTIIKVPWYLLGGKGPEAGVLVKKLSQLTPLS
jgi:hypothetical protein